MLLKKSVRSDYRKVKKTLNSLWQCYEDCAWWEWRVDTRVLGNVFCFDHRHRFPVLLAMKGARRGLDISQGPALLALPCSAVPRWQQHTGRGQSTCCLQTAGAWGHDQVKLEQCILFFWLVHLLYYYSAEYICIYMYVCIYVCLFFHSAVVILILNSSQVGKK